MLVTTTELTHSQRLRRRLDLVLPALAAASMDLLEHPRFRERYVEYCFTLHAIVRGQRPPHGDGAVARSGAPSARMPWRRRSSPTWSSTSRRRCATTSGSSRISRWSAIDRAEVLERPVAATIAGLVGAQYYWAQHCHPAALLGYLLVIEGNPPTPDLVHRLVEQTGHPRQAFRFLEKHAQLSSHHRDDLHAMLDELPLSTENLALIGISALHTVRWVTMACFRFGPLPENNVLQFFDVTAAVAGTVSPSISDGIHVMLAPLARGASHAALRRDARSHFARRSRDHQDITYELNVRRSTAGEW